ncbi:MAG: AsmA family protein, partial [Gammaproteobacteria bacterium]
MNPIRILLTLLKLFGVGIGLLAALLIVVSVVGVKIPVNFLKGTIQDAARDATGRELLIDGAIVLSPGFSPGVSIQNVTLANSENAQTPSFIRVNELSLQIHLLPLLGDKIHIGDVMLSGVDVDLVKPVTGAPNWIFEPLETGETVNKAEPRDQKKPGMSLIAIDGVRLSDLSISYRDEASQTHNNLTLSSGMLQAPEDIPASFRGEGMLNALPVSMQLESDPLQKLFAQSFPLNLEFVSKIGATDLEGFIKAVDSGMHISIDLLGEDLSQLGDNFGFSLPDVRNYQASTSIDYDKKEFRISAFHATVDNSDIDAELTMSHGRSPVEISGAIDINTLELDPFLKSTDEKNVSSTAQVSGPPEQEKSINTGEISDLIKQLSKYAADLRVNIGRLTAGGLVITDSNLQLNLAEGKLNTPVKVVLNSIPMEGKFSLSQTDGLVTASASLEVQNTDIGDLEQWFNLDGIDGSLGKFSLNVATNGQNLQSLAKQISADLVIEGAELQYGGDEKVQGVAFTLERMSASVAGQSPLAVTANGVLLDQAFTIDLTGGKLSHLLTGADWPLEITAKGAGAELRIEGNIREPGEQTGSELSLLLSGSRLGDLYNWLGVSNKAEAAYIIRALASTRVNGWEISSYEIGLGET